MNPSTHRPTLSLFLGIIGLFAVLHGVPANAQLVIVEQEPGPVLPAVPVQNPVVEAPVATIRPAEVVPSKHVLRNLRPDLEIKVTPLHPLVRHYSPKGEMPSVIEVREGWARDVPLSIALAQVIPPGWRVDDSRLLASASHHPSGEPEKPGKAPVARQAPVSWEGGKSWSEVLNVLANEAGFRATIAWDRKQVFLVDDGAPFFEPAPLVETWLLSPSLTLRENVEAWAAKAGWNQVVWEAVDYPVVAPVTFKGDFVSPDGPLAQLIQAYERSDQPLLVRLKTLDKVVHVVNKNYRPVRVAPASPYHLVPEVFPNSPQPAPGTPPVGTAAGHQ